MRRLLALGLVVGIVMAASVAGVLLGGGFGAKSSPTAAPAVAASPAPSATPKPAPPRHGEAAAGARAVTAGAPANAAPTPAPAASPSPDPSAGVLSDAELIARLREVAADPAFSGRILVVGNVRVSESGAAGAHGSVGVHVEGSADVSGRDYSTTFKMDSDVAGLHIDESVIRVGGHVYARHGSRSWSIVSPAPVTMAGNVLATLAPGDRLVVVQRLDSPGGAVVKFEWPDAGSAITRLMAASFPGYRNGTCKVTITVRPDGIPAQIWVELEGAVLIEKQSVHLSMAVSYNYTDIGTKIVIKPPKGVTHPSS